jgi:hypothetical protein
VDVLGLLLLVVVTAAHVQDRNGAQLLLSPLAKQFRRWRLLWADGAYAGQREPWTCALGKWGKVRLEIVRKPKGQKGFVVLPWRGRVERTFRLAVPEPASQMRLRASTADDGIADLCRQDPVDDTPTRGILILFKLALSWTLSI